MRLSLSNIRPVYIAFLFCSAILISENPALGQTETVIYNFCSAQYCSDGTNPNNGPLVMDSQGNLYGTTYEGGVNGVGAVFKVSAEGNESVLYSFSNSTGDGYWPSAGLVRDHNGNFYGTTFSGGAFNRGTVFKVDPAGKETILYSFGSTSANDGTGPSAAVVRDAKGNLYGTTEWGGTYGYGTLFELNVNGTESVLHSFANDASDGGRPTDDLTFDQQGSLYGTTSTGGFYGSGTVFRLSVNGTETVLHSFGSKSDGQTPYGRVILGKSGELYGTTRSGGAFRDGSVFKLSQNGVEWVLKSFVLNTGAGPFALLLDSAGNIYGVTVSGGPSNSGTVFEINVNGTTTTLHSFSGPNTDGSLPTSLFLDSTGNLYGTTWSGGTGGTNSLGGGTLFKIAR